MSAVRDQRRKALAKLDEDAYKAMKEAEDAVWEAAGRQDRRDATDPAALRRKYPSLGNGR